jgi:hypothetical protein
MNELHRNLGTHNRACADSITSSISSITKDSIEKLIVNQRSTASSGSTLTSSRGLLRLDSNTIIKILLFIDNGTSILHAPLRLTRNFFIHAWLLISISVWLGNETDAVVFSCRYFSSLRRIDAIWRAPSRYSIPTFPLRSLTSSHLHKLSLSLAVRCSTLWEKSLVTWCGDSYEGYRIPHPDLISSCHMYFYYRRLQHVVANHASRPPLYQVFLFHSSIEWNLRN